MSKYYEIMWHAIYEIVLYTFLYIIMCILPPIVLIIIIEQYKKPIKRRSFLGTI